MRTIATAIASITLLSACVDEPRDVGVEPAARTLCTPVAGTTKLTPCVRVQLTDTSWSQRFCGGTISNSFFDATINRDGTSGLWTLTLSPKQELITVAFPDFTDSSGLALGSNADDRVYYPFLGGVVQKWGVPMWAGYDARLATNGVPVYRYPGGTFSPFVIVADNSAATYMAAVNTSLGVTPFYAPTPGTNTPSIALLHHGSFGPGAPAPFQLRALFEKIPTTAPTPAWLAPIDRYRCWLDASSPPPTYDPALATADGFSNIQLQNFGSACGEVCPPPPLTDPNEQACSSCPLDLAALDSESIAWTSFFGSSLIWGQMGTRALACPPPPPSDVTACGCCEDNPGAPPMEVPTTPPPINARYDGLDAWIASQRAKGNHVGLYARPHDVPNAAPDLGPGEQRDFLAAWLAQNYSATTPTKGDLAYADIIGRAYLGSPSAMASLFTASGGGAPVIPTPTIIEGWVDMYPRAGLLSGYLDERPPPPELPNIDDVWPRHPEFGPDVDDETCEACQIPRLVRYTMAQRIGFLGQSNGDHSLYYADTNYYGQRQAFLLGLKLDYIMSQPYAGNTAHAMRAARPANWWTRGIRYLDRRELLVPAATRTAHADARLFTDNDGFCLLATTNPAGTAGLTVQFRGIKVNVPTALYAITPLNGFVFGWCQ